MPQSKRLRIIAGPNGSGKTTVFKELHSRYYCGPYINADEIEEQLKEFHHLNIEEKYGISATAEDYTHFLGNEGKTWLAKATEDGVSLALSFTSGKFEAPGSPGKYDAAIAADFIRHCMLLTGKTFTFETVMSHPSKMDLIRKAQKVGFKIYLYFVCTAVPEINISRVQIRVKEGGHDVPQDKIRKRYYESLQLLPQLIPLTNRTFLIDSSNHETKPVAETEAATKLIIHNENIPWWVHEYVVPMFLNEPG